MTATRIINMNSLLPLALRLAKRKARNVILAASTTESFAVLRAARMVCRRRKIRHDRVFFPVARVLVGVVVLGVGRLGLIYLHGRRPLLFRQVQVGLVPLEALRRLFLLFVGGGRGRATG